MVNIRKATKDYEAWLGSFTPLDAKELAYKHRQMAKNHLIFPFLRATFYRWCQLWPTVCPELKDAPGILAVGDLHVENFGTWRDSEGRLIWGINDFDEAYSLPYTNDLVRLAVSAMMAVKASPLQISSQAACRAILDGYKQSLQKGGRPFVLEEKHPVLRAMALSKPRDPTRFWAKLRSLIGKPEPQAPPEVEKALLEILPQPTLKSYIRRRPKAGLGSLGKPRFVALARWAGGLVAREAKALTPSACSWAAGDHGTKSALYQKILKVAVRCPDPFLQIRGKWIMRRLAPECSRIVIATLATVHDEYRLLHAMGWETANVHGGTKSAAKIILSDLAKRPRAWLLDAARVMARATEKDWKEWKATR